MILTKVKRKAGSANPVVLLVGIEPTRLSAKDFKSLVSTYSTTGAYRLYLIRLVFQIYWYFNSF